MQRNLNIGFENFRVFKDMTEFDFAPITILTGANSSGKSTIIKGIKMMEQFLDQDKLYNGPRGFWEFPLLEFKSSELKILGAFMDIINDPQKEFILMSFKGMHEYFGNYRFIFKYVKNGNIKGGRLQNVSLYINDSQKPIIEFKCDTSRWECKANYVWLAEALKDFFFTLERSEDLAKIYYPLAEEFIQKLSLECYNEDGSRKEGKMADPYRVYARGFIPDIMNEFADILTEKEFDFNEFVNLRTKLKFLYETKCETDFLINKNSNVKNYYDYWTNQKTKVGDLIFIEQKLQPILSSLEENFSASGLYSKFIETYPHLSAEKDLFEDCEAVFHIPFPQKAIKKIDQHILEHASTGFLPADSEMGIKIPDINNNTIARDASESSGYILFQNINRLSYIYLDENKVPTNRGVFRNIEQLNSFTTFLFSELLGGTQKFFKNIEVIEANRAEMRRSYDFQVSNSPFAQFIQNFCQKEYRYKLFHVRREYKYEIVNHWLNEFEIADSMEITINEDGDAAKIFLVKNNVKRNIADLGYGTTKLLPLLMYVANYAVNNGVRLNSCIRDGEYHHMPVGSPSTLDMFDEPNKFPYTICIEEPETNLHPMMQSKLADFFVYCAKELNIRFIIETHSDALIRKLQYLTAKGDASTSDSIIYYVGNPDVSKRAPNEEQVRKIEIKRNGQLSQPFGSGFTDEATKWIKEMFAYSNLN